MGQGEEILPRNDVSDSAYNQGCRIDCYRHLHDLA